LAFKAYSDTLKQTLDGKIRPNKNHEERIRLALAYWIILEAISKDNGVNFSPDLLIAVKGLESAAYPERAKQVFSEVFSKLGCTWTNDRGIDERGPLKQTFTGSYEALIEREFLHQLP
jgi:hypothetical protein